MCVRERESEKRREKKFVIVMVGVLCASSRVIYFTIFSPFSMGLYLMMKEESNYLATLESITQFGWNLVCQLIKSDLNSNLHLINF